MTNNPEKIYDPKPFSEIVRDAMQPEAEPVRRGPGRPPKPRPEPAVEVSPGLTADASLTPTGQPQEGETLEQAIERIRKIRKPFGQAMQQKLALPTRNGYHRHWFNDVAGRVDEAKESGWSHVKSPRDGTPLKRVVGTGRDNGVLWAYAMELPEVFWQEEMAARHSVAKEKVDAIKSKVAVAKQGQAQASDQGKFYSPSDAPVTITEHIVRG